MVINTQFVIPAKACLSGRQAGIQKFGLNKRVLDSRSPIVVEDKFHGNDRKMPFGSNAII
jgi:hypothetical protein